MTEHVENLDGVRRCGQCGEAAVRAEARFCRACGTELDVAVDGKPPRRRIGPLTGRRLLVIGVVLATAVLAVGLGRMVQRTGSPPEQPVEELLAAVAEGRSGKVAELLGIDTPPLPDEESAEGYEPPTGMRITDVRHTRVDTDTLRPDRSHASVEVEYRIGDETHSMVLEVLQGGTGTESEWRLASRSQMFLGRVEVDSPHFGTVSIGGTELEPGFGLPTARPWALPGSYTVAGVGDHPLFEAQSMQVAVHPEARVGATEILVDEVGIRPGLASEVEEQVDARIRECAEATVLVPPSCPFALDRDSFFTVRDVRWTVVEPPEIELLLSTEEITGTKVAVETTVPGTAKVEFSYTNIGDGPQERTVDIVVGGTVRAVDGRAVWD